MMAKHSVAYLEFFSGCQVNASFVSRLGLCVARKLGQVCLVDPGEYSDLLGWELIKL